jgi:Cu/Ag efflux pump CusA
MPATLPGASIQTMKQTIQEQDKILMGFPEVASVFAKAGRAESATDPAPLENGRDGHQPQACGSVADGHHHRKAH